jgi:dipeptidyl aminopeptidase/acylaminoacyl peptidase
VEQWLERGAYVLAPNYRGSIGYGERFRRLTMGDSGHAESKDIESGISYLVGRGLVDPQRIAVAGHSWGGYLSAYLATTSKTFRAAEVDSGITDNTANYVMSNAGVSELGYLQSSPWVARDLWARASAVGNTGKGDVPTLIQHGANDPVVPVINAYLFDRALYDSKVPVRTVIYANTEHHAFRPKERLTANLLNLEWFEVYLWGDRDVLPWMQDGEAGASK